MANAKEQHSLTTWKVERLTATDRSDFTATARLLDAMSQYHSDNVPEVFDYRRPPKTAEYVEGLVGEEDMQLWVVRDAGKVVGVLHAAIKSGKTTPGWRPRRYGSIEAMLVEAAYRHQGMGHTLVKAAHGYFRAQQLKTVELNVWGFNTAARRLYERAGYRVKNLNLWRKL